MEVRGIDKIWAADLADMQAFSKENDGIRYLLCVVDVFSKYGWMRTLENKTGIAVAREFKNIFKVSDRKPGKIWVDKGKEFYNKEVKALGVELYSTENEEKSCIVERWLRTMKQHMFKYFSANNTRRYVDVLNDLVNNYNNTKHSSVKMTPVEASEKKNENKVWLNLYGISKAKQLKPKFAVGDNVRISRKKGVFEKGYTSNWTEEIFTVTEVQYTDPITYKIKDLNDEQIQGTFYEQELQKTKQEVYRIEKVIKKRGNKSLVKWVGYPEAFNSWVDNSDLIKL